MSELQDQLEKSSKNLPDDIIENFRKNEYITCKEKCMDFIISEPTNCIALYYLGKIAESEKEHDSAIGYYKKILDIEPRFPFVWSGIGDSYTELGKHDQAYKSYIEEVALMPQKAAPWCKASLSVHNMGDTILGIEILKLAQNRVDPDGQSGVAFAIGAFYELLDDKDNALIYYMQGQASATKDEDRDVSSKRIYKMLKE